MHKCTVPSEPSVTVPKGGRVTKGFSDGGASKCWYQLPKPDTLTQNSTIAIGMPDEGSCRIVAGCSIGDKVEVNQAV